ncbi:MAG TPA: bifunctional hydroxymethylpyrimidine kinase/phosphomethylpyrimidine kinase [Bryobacteraceae bacterium]|nr:bifunctional hydroxymethylpyrimidine kinase/phosphomethylpyrimidine kinase [Bryobacteraceae bacterium]
MTPVALTVAGSDPSGGAGIQADLKTFHRFGAYGEAVITLITVQNTRSVERVEILDPELVAAQIRAVLADIPPRAAKTGALGNAAVIEAVARELAACTFPLIVDPVMISKHGTRLMRDEDIEALRRYLLPMTALLTPNLPEAAALSGLPVDSVEAMRDPERILQGLGCRAVLVKGGHLAGPSAIDVLLDESGGIHELPSPRLNTVHTHGTGCTYSSAITAGLASGLRLYEAVFQAKRFIARAIETNPGLGGGSGPVNHFA